MDIKSIRSKSHELSGFENGERSLKVPTATFEQMSIAKMSKPGNDAELKRSVIQLQELTQCTEDEAVTALYDCENNIERAVELLLDKLRNGINEDWHTTGRKARVKHTSTNESETSVTNNTKEVLHVGDKQRTISATRRAPQSRPDGAALSNKVESYDGFPRYKNTRGSKSSAVTHSLSSESSVAKLKEDKTKSRAITSVAASRDQRPNLKLPGISDGWDPYTEYGEWGGESIEVINSNASLARGMQADSSIPDELLVDTDNKPIQEPSSACASGSSVEVSSPKSVHFGDDSLFVSKASSKLPPPAFTALPDLPVFIVPETLPRTHSNHSFRFGGDHYVPLMMAAASHTKLPSSSTKQNTVQGTPIRTELETQIYSSSHGTSSTFELSNSPRTISRDNAALSENKSETQKQNYSSNHFQNVNLPPKSPISFPVEPTAQTNTTFNADRSGAPSNFLESSLKNYLLDNLPGEINKLSVANPSAQNEASVHFSLPSSQSQSISSFPHGQTNSGTSIQQQLPKATVSHATTHGPFQSSQQPISSTSHQPPATAMPPGMPHYISQFAPTPYHMFNLPGGSGNAPAVLEQLFHQHNRMFYDMHLHQQAATTAQSLLTSNSESSSTGKTHAGPGPMNHVTATSAAVRPDLLASAMGHAPQMLPTGHPFFSYPGFVLMNGYPNAFVNQQSGPESNAPQGPNHACSSMTQASSQPSQPFSGIKPGSTTGMSYEEYFDMKYGDPAKQVGYKSGPQTSSNYNAFQGHISSVDGVGPKLPTAHSTTSGLLNQAFNINSGVTGGNNQPFLPQFYTPNAAASPYLNAAVAAAAAQQQQQSQQHVSSGAGTANQSNSGAPPNSNLGQLHIGNSHTQSMALGSSGPNSSIHHSHHHSSQRPVMSHQH